MLTPFPIHEFFIAETEIQCLKNYDTLNLNFTTRQIFLQQFKVLVCLIKGCRRVVCKHTVF